MVKKPNYITKNNLDFLPERQSGAMEDLRRYNDEEMYASKMKLYIDMTNKQRNDMKVRHMNRTFDRNKQLKEYPISNWK